MPGMNAPPYASLTPDRVLDALEGVGLCSEGRLLALNSYENRVYQIGIHDGPAVAVPHVIVKFYRPGRLGERRDHRDLVPHDLRDEGVFLQDGLVPPS